MQRLINKAGWAVAGALAVALLAALAGVIYAGPLDPPKAPAPTQANLIFQPATGCAGFPIVLATQGAYTLAENIDMPASCGKNGIEISGGQVVLDLAGFRVDGGGFNAGSLDGIKATGGCGGCELKNGTVQRWGGAGINFTSANDAQVHDVRVQTMGGAGIKLGPTNVLTNCAVVSNGQAVASDGIDASAANDVQISNCSSSSNTRNGVTLGGRSVLRDCVVDLNTQLGVLISGNDSVIANCGVSFNTAQGIRATGANNKIVRNHAAENASAGGTCADIWADGPGTLVEDNTAEGTAPSHCPFYFDGAGSVGFGNTARNGVAGGDYSNFCSPSCDVPPQTTATGATNPRGNVGD